ncbi:MAG: DUF6144 family protein [Planctomycetota bacterium]
MTDDKEGRVNRRKFVKISGVTGLGLATSGACPAHAQEENPEKKFNMDYAKWWINMLLDKLGSRKKQADCLELLEECGRECAKRFTGNALPAVKEKIKGKKNLDIIVEILKKAQILSAASGREGKNILCVYETCPCPVRKSGLVDSPVICNCTKGFKKHVFETIMDQPVTVTLRKSIGQGHDRCEMVIHVDGFE